MRPVRAEIACESLAGCYPVFVVGVRTCTQRLRHAELGPSTADAASAVAAGGLADSFPSTFGRGTLDVAVSETSENTALVELLDGIADRRIRRKVMKLLQFGEEAVRSLGELDSALYLRENGEEQLQIVSDAVLSHVRRLLEYLGMVAGTVEVKREAVSEEVEFEFATGDSLGIGATDTTGPSRTPTASEPSGAATDRGNTDDDKWRALAGEMDSLQYGLGSELREYDRRFLEALEHDRKDQAVRDLNDATTSLMDGVFAVMTTVYECFLGYAEPERMIPGHRDSLGKALAVRRGLAELRREVQEMNRPIQDRSSRPLVVDTSYKLMVDTLARFIDGDTFSYLRSDDRKEFAQFRELLVEGSAAKNRQQCEGFDKYLDSLSFVSQRGVLIKHDTDLRAKMATELERAVAYAQLLPDVVCEAIHQAFVKGERLFGLDDQLDSLVYKWSSFSEQRRNDVDAAVAMAQQLLSLVRPTPRPSSSGGGDFF